MSLLSDSENARFLGVLAPGVPVTFQTYSDREELKVTRPDGEVYDPNARILHGTLEQRSHTLSASNRRGVGVFVMVNAGDLRGRAAKNVVRVRALFIDTDGARYPSGLPLEPHLVVQSSPGRWHFYWLVDDVPLADFAALQEGLADLYGTDPSIKDPPRVMRLPGFYHQKAEPVMVRLLEAREGPRYPYGSVLEAWPGLARRLEQERQEAAEQEQRRADALRAVAERRAHPVDDHTRSAAKRLLQAHHDTVASSGPGTRHDTLLRSARALGGYVGSGTLGRAEVEDALSAAADVCGLPGDEAARVIAWGLDVGIDAPLFLAPFDENYRSSNKSPQATQRTDLMNTPRACVAKGWAEVTSPWAKEGKGWQ